MKKAIILTIILLGSVSFGAKAQLGGVLKKAKEKAASSSSAPAPSAGDLIQPDACIENVKSRLETIINVYYKDFKNSPGYIKKDGSMWFARKDFEAARFYYTGGKEGFTAGGRQCDMGSATADQRYKDLKPLMEEAETKLKEMETAKGIEFVGVKPDNNVIFKNIKTGKEYTAGESNHL
jgi:hypothetical protein